MIQRGLSIQLMEQRISFMGKLKMRLQSELIVFRLNSFPYIAISVALAIDKQVVIGIVYNPVLDFLYSAVKGSQQTGSVFDS